MNIDDLKVEYDKLQLKYGAKELDSIYNGGCQDEPDICFVFMNPTGRNIASDKTWTGRKSPWLGTKNIWKLFYNVNLLSEDTFNKIQSMRPKDWDYEFCDYVYDEIEKNKVFITNLGKCTQIDARALPDDVLKKYLKLLLKEIDIIKPKVIITFGNQVSSIILDKKISVSENRKTCHELKINKNKYKVYPVYYPVGNGIFNIDKAIEDIKWIIDEEIKKNKNQ
jgi:DNA polymerase